MQSILTFLAGAAILLLLLLYVGTAAHTTKRWIGTALTLLATLCAVLSVKYMGLKKGIDLQGGSEFVVQLQVSKMEDGTVKEVTPDSIQQAIGILERRLNPDGQKDLLLAPQGDDRILIQMPGVKPEEVEMVRQQIQQVAHLEFRIVPPEGKSALAQFESSGLQDPRFTRMPYKDKTKGAEMVGKRADVEGKHVTRAGAYYDAQGWKVSLELDSEGAKQFDAVAAIHQGHQMAIIVDGEIISAPELLTSNYNGRAEISGNFKQEEVRTLASLLENPLENPMKILSESAVSASYGEASIEQGKLVCIGGLVLTALFMMFIYRTAGLVAIVGLVINLALLFGAMALFQFTLTMPGIAGIVLTIGTAVDANVLIYERLREEMDAGRSFAGALDAAYDKAFSAIADSNVTHMISATILFIIAGGLVKGFAVTLMIGVVSSMIGALVVTRVIFMWVIDKGILKSFHATRIVSNKLFDILGHAKGFIIASLVITAISFATLAVKGKNSFGIDFRGGALTHIELADKKDIADADLENFLKTLKMPDGSGIGTVYVQRKKVGSATELTVRSEFDAGQTIKEAVIKKYGDAVKSAGYERVGSTIGFETAMTSLWALLGALVAIFIYLMFRFEFAFAVGAIVALFHDVLMVPGLCVLFGQELSVIHVGALLTIAGYSINDTIVVFDRIRETIQRGGGGSIRDMMNEAICMTLSRTLLTGPTALAPMIALLFMGNAAMVEFAMPITIGVILGTYSSIFIASPLVLWYARRTGQSLKRQVLDTHLAEQKAQQALAAANAGKL